MEFIHLFISFYFIFLEFCGDFGDFFEVVLGGGGGLYLWVVVGGYACVWLWVCYNFVLVFVYGGRFLFCIFFIWMVFKKKKLLYIILMYRIEK